MILAFCLFDLGFGHFVCLRHRGLHRNPQGPKSPKSPKLLFVIRQDFDCVCANSPIITLKSLMSMEF